MRRNDGGDPREHFLLEDDRGVQWTVLLFIEAARETIGIRQQYLHGYSLKKEEGIKVRRSII